MEESRTVREDEEIIQLYWDRNEDAIPATQDKYGGYCFTIARNVLASREDAEECVNETWWRAWNAMPTQWPDRLAAFLGKITRNLSFNRYRHNHAEKRQGDETALVLDELAEVVSGQADVGQEVERKELVAAINEYLAGLTAQKRILFVGRYWYGMRVKDLAESQQLTQDNASVILNRLRKDLRRFLLERGFVL